MPRSNPPTPAIHSLCADPSSIESGNNAMTSSTDQKQSFNLSRWAIAHPSIARFLFGLILITGVLGLMRMGQKEDPDFTFRVMVVQAIWPGASIQGHGRSGRQQDRAQAAGNPASRFRPLVHASPAAPSLPCRSRATPMPPRLPMPSTRCARRSAISPMSCRGACSVRISTMNSATRS